VSPIGWSGAVLSDLAAELGDAGGANDQGEQHGPDGGDEQCNGSGALVLIHRKEISVLWVFCTRKTISRTARSAAAMRAAQAAPVRVRDTRPGDPAGDWTGCGEMSCSVGADVPASAGWG
jgi:hypothetical protein